MRDTFIARLLRHALADPSIVLITGDLGFKVFDEFRAKCPGQFLNAGVAEQNMTAIAAGMALEGRIVFTYSIANFSTLRCLEQIRNDACYHGAAVKVVSIGGGFSYGSLGISHHATEDLAIIRSLPDITVFSPGDLWEAAEATSACIATSGTCYLRLDKAAGKPTYREGDLFVPGRMRTVRGGTDVCVVVTGGILEEAQAAADTLATEGISVRILSAHTIRPLDAEAVVEAARSCTAMLTLEEHTLHGGLGGAVAEVLLDNGVMPRRFRRLGLAGTFSSIVGSQVYLRQRYGIDARAVAEAVRSTLAGPTCAV
ncbi:transketolase [Planctomycetota bacterium]|nr:transketolase [Planctomycetota bacterium]